MASPASYFPWAHLVTGGGAGLGLPFGAVLCTCLLLPSPIPPLWGYFFGRVLRLPNPSTLVFLAVPTASVRSAVFHERTNKLLLPLLLLLLLLLLPLLLLLLLLPLLLVRETVSVL